MVVKLKLAVVLYPCHALLFLRDEQQEQTTPSEATEDSGYGWWRVTLEFTEGPAFTCEPSAFSAI